MTEKILNTASFRTMINSHSYSDQLDFSAFRFSLPSFLIYILLPILYSGVAEKTKLTIKNNHFLSVSKSNFLRHMGIILFKIVRCKLVKGDKTVLLPLTTV